MNVISIAAAAAIAIVTANSIGTMARAAGSDESPSYLPFSYPPDGTHMMGDRAAPGQRAGVPGVTAPLVPPAAPKATEPTPTRSRAQVIDELFQRLGAADDTEAASGVATRLQRLWLESGSDTADLLMSRAADEMSKGRSDKAADLLDKILVLDPDWTEAWNRRATLRFLQDDDFGSMEDIVHVLTLEPRHFGALTGMGMILQRRGQKKEALSIFRKAAVIYPHNTGLLSAIETLTPDVEGRGL